MMKYAMVCAALLLVLSACDSGKGDPAAPMTERAYHHWVWEDESSQESAINLVEGYKQRNIPVGAIIIDSPWETGYNTFEWNSAGCGITDIGCYPDPAGMINYLHSRDVGVFLWITGVINQDNAAEKALYAEGSAKGYFMMSDNGASPGLVYWWKGVLGGGLIDYFNPEAVAWWHTLIDKIVPLGFDGWKVDGVDYYVVLSSYSPYLKKNVERLEYAHAYYRDFFTYARQKLGTDFVMTARPVDTYGTDVRNLSSSIVEKNLSFAPRDILWSGWTGDLDATFDGMQKGLESMYESSRLKYLAFGTDIGGYRDGKDPAAPVILGRTKELFLRWAQLGALSPVMENGGGGEHRPWKFDEYYGGTETTDIYRRFTVLHMNLLPYLMGEIARAWREGVSVMSFTSNITYQYLLGHDLFVAPILNYGGAVTAAFPAGSTWVYLFDKTKTYAGGSTATLTVPLAEFPVFVRQGSTLETTLVVP